jgi:hypothetical protein
MKQFMVLKMVGKSLKGVLEIVPLMGIVSRERAEEAVERLHEEEPESVFLIQEVGTA